MIGNRFFPSGGQFSKNKENCKFFDFISQAGQALPIKNRANGVDSAGRTGRNGFNE